MFIVVSVELQVDYPVGCCRPSDLSEVLLDPIAYIGQLVILDICHLSKAVSRFSRVDTLNKVD